MRLVAFVACGPRGPEDSLYHGTRSPDGTRNGGQVELINKLIQVRVGARHRFAARRGTSVSKLRNSP